MDTELTALDEKISQLITLCKRLRAENTDLRQEIAKKTSENKSMSEKINGAKTRLEDLLDQIPESEE